MQATNYRIQLETDRILTELTRRNCVQSPVLTAAVARMKAARDAFVAAPAEAPLKEWQAAITEIGACFTGYCQCFVDSIRGSVSSCENL